MITKKKRKKEKKTHQEIGSSRNHLSTFLYLRNCNTITLYFLYIHSSSTRAYSLKNPETIVIISTGCPNIELLGYFYQARQSTHLTIRRDSSLRRITQDKQASSVLSEEIVPTYALVQKSETRLLRRQLSLAVAYQLHNRIVTYGPGTAVSIMGSGLITVPVKKA